MGGACSPEPQLFCCRTACRTRVSPQEGAKQDGTAAQKRQQLCQTAATFDQFHSSSHWPSEKIHNERLEQGGRENEVLDQAPGAKTAATADLSTDEARAEFR